MPFPPWQSVPPATKVQDLFTTSLLVYGPDVASGILLRCSPGLEHGSATVVHATASRPDALKMTGIDDDTQITAQARILLGDSTVHVVAIPHIAWKGLGGGLPRRTPIATAIALLTAVVLYLPPLSLSAWVALPAAAVLGLLAWLLLRERIPTRIGSPEDPPMTAAAVVERAKLSLGSEPRTVSEAGRSSAGQGRWAPPVS